MSREQYLAAHGFTTMHVPPFSPSPEPEPATSKFLCLEIYHTRLGGFIVSDGRTMNDRHSPSEILYASSNLDDALSFIENHLAKT